MADTNFRARKGLTVGETQVTVDGTTGDIVTVGDIQFAGGDLRTTNTLSSFYYTGLDSHTFNIDDINTTTGNTKTVNIAPAGQSGSTTAVNIGSSTAGATSTINLYKNVTVNGDLTISANNSINLGTTPYSGSTDIYRNQTGTAGIFDGVQISNAGMTNTQNALVIRGFGQTQNNGTTTTSGVAPIFNLSSRGTAASPLATGTGDTLSTYVGWGNFGDNTGTGIGQNWQNDLYPTTAAPAQMLSNATENHRRTQQAVFTANTTGTTLTVTAVTSGTITAGHEIRGLPGVTGTFVIQRQITTTAAGNALGSTGTYQLSGAPGNFTGQTLTSFSVTAGAAWQINAVPAGFVPVGGGFGNMLYQPWNGSTGNLNVTANNLPLNPIFAFYPVRYRFITAITGGDTLNIGTHGLTATGATFRVTGAGNPNGLTTNQTYYVVTIVDSSNVKISLTPGGSPVTGLTNGTNLFITVDLFAQTFTGGVDSSRITLNGSRAGRLGGSSTQVDNMIVGDEMGKVVFTGNQLVGTTTATLFASAAETQSAGARGNQFNLQTIKSGTTTTFTTIISATASSFNTDSFTVTNTANTQMLSVDSTGNLIIAGDLRVNGNDILNSTGNTTITMQTGAGAKTIFAGNIEIDGNTIQNSTGNNAILMATGAAPLITIPGVVQVNSNTINNSAGAANIILSSTSTNIIANNTAFSHPTQPGNLYTPTIIAGSSSTRTTFNLQNASTTGSLFPTFNFQSVRFDGTNLSPTQFGDVLGEYKFNGNTASSGSNPGVPAGPGANIVAVANEIWTNTANGTDFTFSVIKKGTITNITSLKLGSDDIRLRGDQITLQDSNSVALTSAAVNYTRTYGEFAYTNAAGFNIPAQNTIYTMPLDTTLNNSGVTISGTGNININVSGWYKIIISLQVTLTVSNQPGQIDFWLRKNGADVPNSKTQVDLLKDQKAVIAMDWLVNSDGNDYWEIVYVGTSANYADIDFPTIAATTTPYVSPVAPALIVNVIPAGM